LISIGYAEKPAKNKIKWKVTQQFEKSSKRSKEEIEAHHEYLNKKL